MFETYQICADERKGVSGRVQQIDTKQGVPFQEKGASADT